MRVGGILKTALLFNMGLALVIGASPADALQQASAVVSLAQTWAFPAESQAGSVQSVRLPGIYPSPDSTKFYSLLNRRTFGGYGCDGGASSSLQSIDARTGAVLSTAQLDLPQTMPVHNYAMDYGTSRMVVYTGCLDTGVWTSIDVATGARIAQWRHGWADRVVMGTDPGVIFLLTSIGSVANLDYRKVVEAVSTNTGKSLWTSPIEGAPAYIGGWESSAYQGARHYEGRTMAVSSDGSRLYLLRSWENRMQVLDTTTGASVGIVELPPSGDLRTIVASPVSPRAFITDWTNNTVQVIDTESLRLVNSLPINGRCPENMDIDATGELLAVHVACDQPRIIVIRTSDGSQLTETAAPGDITQLTVMPNRQALITARNADLTGYDIKETLPATQSTSKTRPVPAPLAPRGVSANAGTNGAQVSWQSPANSTLSKVTGYRVIAKPTGQLCVTKASKSSCTFSGLVPGKKYQFTVEARNTAAYGLKALSPVISIPRPAPAPEPEKPPAVIF
jgi:DNA-binding beta-propeller fold protein YncE